MHLQKKHCRHRFLESLNVNGSPKLGVLSWNLRMVAFVHGLRSMLMKVAGCFSSGIYS